MIIPQHFQSYRKQRGAALILLVLMLMGVGGLLLSDFLQEKLKRTEDARFEHNRKVLEEAKQALLMYAYNYPNLIIPNYENLTPSMGPGRLPCPDNNNDGLVETFPDYDLNAVVEFSESVTSNILQLCWQVPME